MTIHETFIVETFLLSRVNPEQWERYIHALDVYTQEIMAKAIMNGEPALVGMAKQAMMFASEMTNLDYTYRKIKERQA